MIDLLFNLATGTAKLASAAVLKPGGDVPVRLTFSTAPGVVGALQLGLGSDTATPAVLAFTDTFAMESAAVWTAVLNANDTRLIAFMAALTSAVVILELSAVLDGQTLITPNLPATVQQRLLTGASPGTGGPVYYQTARPAIANAAQTVAVVFATAFAGTPVVPLPGVEKAAGGDDDIFCTGIYGLTAAGFTAQLSAPVPNANYHLHWSAFKP